MKIEQAIERNPFDEKIGNISAYCRYLRYNVDGLYDLTNDEVKEIYKKQLETLNH